MHGGNPFLGTTRGQLAEPAHGVQGLRNLFAPLAAEDAYGSGLPQLMGGEAAPRTRALPNGGFSLMHGVFPNLSTLLKKLNARIERGHGRFWADTLGPGVEVWENPTIPSGYTYFMQLIAHDTVASAAALAIDPKARPVLRNLRPVPLNLDTLYGGGPDACPQVYELDKANGESRGLVPRTRLRLGPRRAPPAGSVTSDCPFRDIARATPTDSADGGLDQPWMRSWRTEALLADSRNDAHALMSQTTVLFQLLHNQVLALLEARPVKVPQCSASEIAYRRFVAARLAVTLIYRAIIEQDLLRLILHPVVHARYADRANRLLDPAPGIPLEFSHAAFRFGHAMVRETYRTNGETPLPMERGLMQSSGRSPGFLPVSDAWLIDWARFFPTCTIAPNLSRRIGPDYAPVLRKAEAFGARDENDTAGLPARDLMGACFAGIWSAPKLYARLRTELTAGPVRDLLIPFELWHEALVEWLSEPDGTGITDPFTPAEIEALASDPPLPFFVLFEAAHAIVGGKPVRAGGGSHLGPLGSIIVAEALFGALRNFPLGIEAAGATLAVRMAKCCGDVLQDADALAAVPEIESMPALLGFLAAGGAFGGAGA